MFLRTSGVVFLSQVVLLCRGVQVATVKVHVGGVRAKFDGSTEIFQRTLTVLQHYLEIQTWRGTLYRV